MYIQKQKMEGTIGSSSSSSLPSNKSSFTSAMTLSKMGSPHVPQHYVLPPLQRQNSSTTGTTAALPIIDLSSLHDPSRRFLVINDIRRACMEVGNFQVINHGIPLQLMKDALDAATHFFNLPQEDKMLLLSDNIHEPVRYGTSLNHAIDKVYYWRDFIKHYSNPLSAWIHLWPENPSNYREKMGNYAMAVQNLQVQLMEVVLQSLGLKRDYMQDEITEGQQVMAVNYYPACPEPQFVLGMPPHTDFGSLTILLQSSQGLEYMDCNQNWVSAPAIEGALIVQLGDQLEVMTNGRYKSVNHRVTVNAEQNRISIASLHSLALNKKIRPAPELVDDQNPASYEEFSFNDFLKFIAKNDITKGRFLDTVKKS